MLDELSLPLPAEWVDLIAAAVVVRVKAELSAENGHTPWLTRQAAADYLGVPVSRLEKDRRVPCHRWDGRVFYHRAELDAFLLNEGDSQ